MTSLQRWRNVYSAYKLSQSIPARLAPPDFVAQNFAAIRERITRFPGEKPVSGTVSAVVAVARQLERASNDRKSRRKNAG